MQLHVAKGVTRITKPNSCCEGSNERPKLHLRHLPRINAQIGVGHTVFAHPWLHVPRSAPVSWGVQLRCKDALTTTMVLDVRRCAKVPPNSRHWRVLFQLPTKNRSNPQKPLSCCSTRHSQSLRLELGPHGMRSAPVWCSLPSSRRLSLKLSAPDRVEAAARACSSRSKVLTETESYSER